MNHQEYGTEPTQPRQGLNYQRRRTVSNDRPLELHRLRVVVALGGNALDGKTRQGVYAAQVRNALAASRQILEIVKAGHQVVLTHGNGPQVGNLALQDTTLGWRLVNPEMERRHGTLSMGETAELLADLGEISR
ncbi:MAG: hypothetical protein JRN56_06120, partial [Nitrososphaerota archaeon]|nr:hypothetical protein [Nitrososphaerota archaeon]